MHTYSMNARMRVWQLKKQMQTEYRELTNAIQAAAHEQLTAQELQEMNQPSTIQDLIKRMYTNTRAWKRRQWKRQQQHNNQQQPDTAKASKRPAATRSPTEQRNK